MAKAKKLPSGSWRVRIKDTSDAVSPWKSFTAPTAAEAEFMAAQYLYERKEKAKPENKTVGECMDAYIDGRSNILSPSTISLYRLLRRTAYPDIVEVKIGKITQPAIQSTINKYAGDHAYKTVKNAEAFLHVVLTEYRPDLRYKPWPLLPATITTMVPGYKMHLTHIAAATIIVLPIPREAIIIEYVKYKIMTSRIC